MLGFKESFGMSLVKTEYVARVLSDVFRKNGYSKVSIPIIELASSFSEDVVGKSPWPEWNEKGCFYFDVFDYVNNYDEQPAIKKALLIPEGTVSITRWLGESIDSLGTGLLPLRVFYDLKCFRNELISTLSETKGREFSQFGMEIMGDDSILNEVETISLIISSMEALGVDRKDIHIRFNDVSIFNKLVSETGLSNKRIELKECLDALAEIKAGKKIERFSSEMAKFESMIKDLDSESIEKWRAISGQDNYSIDYAMQVFGLDYAERFQNLRRFRDAMQQYDVNIDLDLCVIRSHEYYTSMSFEVDVCGKQQKYVEIAGGGRYDRLVENFVSSSVPCKSVPCVGFAFGMERVIDLLDREDLLRGERKLSSSFNFDDAFCNNDTDLSEILRSASSELRI